MAKKTTVQKVIDEMMADIRDHEAKIGMIQEAITRLAAAAHVVAPKLKKPRPLHEIGSEAVSCELPIEQGTMRHRS